VIFGDGIEHDRVELRRGQEARIATSAAHLNLVAA